MRNSEAQRYARWSATVAAVVALIVAGVYLRNLWLAKEAAKRAPPAVPASIEQRSNEFSYSKVEGQRTIYTIRASRATEFKEGSRNLLEDVDIVVYGKTGQRNDTLRTRACDFIASTGKISCAGDVQIKLQSNNGASGKANAIEVATSGVSFDRNSGEARSDKPVTFRWPAGEGRAVGVHYDSNSGTLNLVRDVDLNISPSSPAPGEKAEASPEKNLHLTGNTMAFHRESRRVQLQGDVHAQLMTHDVAADNLLLVLDTDFRAQRLVASGHPQLHESDPQGPMALTANEIASAWRPDGSIESIDATGSVQATRNTPAGEEQVSAGHLRLALATPQNLLRLLTGTGGVTLTSTSAVPSGGTRRVESDALEVHFSNTSGTRQAQIDSVNTLAPAHVDWRNVSLVNGKPVPQIMRMSGNEMNLKFGAQNQLRQLTSTGAVEVTRKLGDAPEQTTASRELTAKFSTAGEWTTIDQVGDVHFRDGQRTGQGDRAHADHATGDVTLDGSVVFANATMRTTARSVTFSQGSSTLRATGNVLTTELSAGTGGVSNFAPEPAHISAQRLVADTARGNAVYSGNGRLWQGQSVIEANSIELDGASHAVVARGAVRGVFPQAAWSPRPEQTSLQTHSRTPSKKSNGAGNPGAALGRVWGGLLTYWEEESRARIEQNARVDSEQGSIQADQIDLYFSGTDASSANKQLSRAVATGDVSVRQEDRRGTSNRAEYTAAEGKFVLSGGNPTLYSSTGDTTTGRQLTFYFADDRIVVDSADGAKTVTLHRVEK
jgi:lipopolysaccharide export system protein LptA